MPLFIFTSNSDCQQVVGKRENVLKLSYLQNDKEQDSSSTNVCLRYLHQMIMKGCVGQVKFGTAVNCNILRTICKIIILLNYLNMTQY